MAKRSSGVAWGNWLVSKTSGMLDARLSRRSFIARTTLLGSAVAATGCAVITQPGSPYQSVAGCSGGLCTDGYTEFCCVINGGLNSCPPGSTPGGWWRADGSIYCGGGPRYYIDCNEICCGPVIDGGSFCAGCSPCRCAVNCDTRRVHCNYFRYGQCNEQIPIMGPIACRVVICTPPYDTLLNCAPSGAVDDSTANHNANCAAYVPPPPPPPPLGTVAPSTGAALSVGSNPVIATRGSDGALWYQAYNGTAWGGWTSLGGQVNSNVVGVAQGANASMFLRGIDAAFYSFTDTGTWSTIWNPLGGTLTSDPAVVVDQSAATWVFARGTDFALYARVQSGGGWTRLGGRLASDPTAIVDHAGNLSVFLLGTENDLWSITNTGGTWGALGSLGGTLTSNPAAVVDGTGKVWVFARGVGNGLWGINVGVGGWTPYGGQLAGDPIPVVDSTGAVWVFARMAGGGISVMSLASGTWTPLGAWPGGAGTFVADPSAVLAGSTLWVFGLGADYSVWARQYNGTDWTATSWTFLGGVLVPVNA